MKKLILSLVISLGLLLSFGGNALATTSQDVTVTATPDYLSITNTPDSWTLNGITGEGFIFVNTIYYSNPLGDTNAPSATVLDSECRFTAHNPLGAETCDLTINCSDFTGGDAVMVNSNDGTNGIAKFGGYCWYSGMTYGNKVIMKTTGSEKLYSLGLAGDADLKWGAEIKTRLNSWASSDPSTATITIIATAH